MLFPNFMSSRVLVRNTLATIGGGVGNIYSVEIEACLEEHARGANDDGQSSPAKSRFKPPKKHRQSLSTKSPSVSPCSSPPSGSPCKSPEVSSGGSHAMVIGRRGSEDLFENFDKGLKIVHDAREKVSQGPRHGNGET